MNRHNVILLISLFLIVFLGIATKFYQGWQSDWFNNRLGGIFYVVFWMLLIYIFFRQLSAWKISIIVFSLTSFIEILQLWDPVWLEYLRSSFVGRTILGTTFSFDDFIYYAIGAIIGYCMLKLIRMQE